MKDKIHFKRILDMTLFKIKFLILTNLACLGVFGQSFDFVKILPGKGIVYNNDSILLYKTTIKETCKILKIKYYSNSKFFSLRHWDGFIAETGKSVSGVEYVRGVKFKSLDFDFSSESDRNDLKLKWIKVNEDNSLKVYTSDGLVLGMINPKIREIYTLINKNDYISDDKLTYNLYSYGISFHLVVEPNGSLKLSEISTHYKIE